MRLSPERFIVLSFIALVVFVANAAGQPSPATMKAIVAHEYGGPDVLKYEDAPVPEAKENEVLVRVMASGVNPADPLIVSGKYAREFGTHLPLIPGYDIAGVVTKSGAKVTKLKVGDPRLCLRPVGRRLGGIRRRHGRRSDTKTELS
jgi:NADPH:quinone reductase-like Zn-dependent oxidoreductase